LCSISPEITQSGNLFRGKKMHKQNKTNVKHVIIVSKHEGHARVDRETLRGMGAETLAMFTTGREAEAYLRDENVDLVICDAQLGDMSGHAFLRQLRSDPLTRYLPAMLMSLQGDEVEVLKGIASGCSGFVVRPYTLARFEHQVEQARKAPCPPEDAARFADQLFKVREHQARRKGDGPSLLADMQKDLRGWLVEGRKRLKAREYDKAVVAFAHALRLNMHHPEGYEGLAKAWQAKKVPSRYLDNLKKACQLYARQSHYLKVKLLHQEIVRIDEDYGNPFLAEGRRLWKENAFDDALLSYRRAVQLDAADEEALLTLARAYLDLGQREQALEILGQSLERHAAFATSRDMYEKLEASSQGILGRMTNAFGRVRERIAAQQSTDLLTRAIGRIPPQPKGVPDGLGEAS
jgi:CheY-like chemotaxis protein